MSPKDRWNLDDYRALLRMRVQQLHWDPHPLRHFGWADLVLGVIVMATRFSAKSVRRWLKLQSRSASHRRPFRGC